MIFHDECLNSHLLCVFSITRCSIVDGWCRCTMEIACTDEVKVYKDEGEEEEQKKSSENLTEDKVGLVIEGEGQVSCVLMWLNILFWSYHGFQIFSVTNVLAFESDVFCSWSIYMQHQILPSIYLSINSIDSVYVVRQAFWLFIAIFFKLTPICALSFSRMINRFSNVLFGFWYFTICLQALDFRWALFCDVPVVLTFVKLNHLLVIVMLTFLRLLFICPKVTWRTLSSHPCLSLWLLRLGPEIPCNLPTFCYLLWRSGSQELAGPFCSSKSLLPVPLP